MSGNKDSFHKSVTYQVSEELGVNNPWFSKPDFDGSIFGNGYDVYIEKAIKCACRIKATTGSLPNCSNCGSTGWIFVNKRQSKAVMQSMNKQTKFLNWSEVDRGTVSISLRDADKVAFMDRITNLNVVSTYSEAISPRLIKDKLVVYTIYPIIVATECYFFDGVDKKLKQLVLNTDYTILDNKIILNDKFKGSSLDECGVAVRYTHFPQYCVLDVPRDAIANLGALHSCETPGINNEYAPLPIHAIGRKSHFILDEPNFDGVSLFDNTFDPSNTLDILNASLPFSLEFWLARSSGAEIARTLISQADTAKNSLIKTTLP